MSFNSGHMMKIAAVALRSAANKIQQLSSDNEKMAAELCDLKEEAREAQAFEDAMKIASKMHEKGLIKKADVESKAYEISKFDKEAIEIIDASLSGTEKVASAGVSDLSDFMIEEDNTNALVRYHKKTMADAIISAAEDTIL